ncbi:hypothetical protein PRB94_gp73 [Klebsiella phage VLCpiS13c]|uniref:hypothetical protein n=1 Tax=Klebsiella phage VLCpiS13c TaxID=2874887 RepID=UPI00233E9630|nr:hypothetical protein PRB94_gp73 [Klebsiella phage VLCpiS13c]UVX30201.1 hypothetical protein S13c_00073 [Klebsiella phage VLCpiS13c]
MNEFKGTPGPWFGDNGRAIGPKSTEDDQSYGMIIPVGWVEFDPEVEVQVANQRMMAAAPELLEALQIICFFEDISSAQREIAEAAIAKALGESQ